MDESQFEYAELLEQWTRDRAIADAHNKANRARPSSFDGSCTECEGDIDPRRIAAGYYDCIECAQEREQRAKQSM